MQDNVTHRRLANGIDLAVMHMPDRPVVALEIRVLAGFAFEQPEHLGVAYVLSEAISSPAVYEFKGNELYVRARILESNGRVAWTQPVWR